MTARLFTDYEKMHLLRHGIEPQDIAESDTRPVEYITGIVTFCKLPFKVTPETLIPRIETEELVGLAATDLTAQLQQTSAVPIQILDMGTGSGALGISLAIAINQLLPQTTIELDLVDISTEALEVARHNSVLAPQNTKVHFLESNLWEQVSPKKYDLLVANLPYIPHHRLFELDPSVIEHEPHLALDGGADGSELIKQFLQNAKPFLKTDTIIWLEVDHTHNLKLFTDLLPGRTLSEHYDSFDHFRFIRIGPSTTKSESFS